MRGEERREQAGGEAGILLAAGLDQKDLIWESLAGSSLAEHRVCTGGAEEEAVPLHMVEPGPENAWGPVG